MDIKKFLLPLSLALLTTWAIQYFIMNRSESASTQEVRSGQTFLAPQSPLEAQPLNRTINPIETTPHGAAKLTQIETDYATYQFSSAGACLEQLTIKHRVNDHITQMPTLQQGPAMKLENQCFLIALSRQTPYNYSLVNEQKVDGGHQLTYVVETNQATIQKQFFVHQSSYQVDLAITITPKEQPVQARLLFSAPYMPDIKDDTISGIVNDYKGSILKEARTKLDLNKGWLMPTLFGSENRYFVNVLIADQQKFSQRAYYLLDGSQNLISVLESAPTAQQSTWSLSFYFGPKQEEAIRAVDPRLEQTLEYSGWLAPLSRLLLMVLKYLYEFVHNYGWAIILMTVLINLLLLPLNFKSVQHAKKSAEIQKKIAYLEQRHKGNPELLNQEKAALVTKNGMAMIGGCLPKLIQLPIFFALSRVLSNSLELYKAPFLWIPDLSARDPYYILPGILFVSMLFQPSPTNDPNQRFMMIGMALLFSAFAVNFSAGLCLYILIGAILTIAQMNIQQILSR
jgi:YidC/Oxa1 family membrane protein insertase